VTKNVLFYARYSTDRQHEVSIETQIELGEAFVKERGWTMAAIYSNAAFSGTTFNSRPGIQSLMAHVKCQRFDVLFA